MLLSAKKHGRPSDLLAVRLNDYRKRIGSQGKLMGKVGNQNLPAQMGKSASQLRPKYSLAEPINERGAVKGYLSFHTAMLVLWLAPFRACRGG